MKKITLTAVFVSLFALSQVSAQAPIYLVNGEIRHDISDIRPDDIEKTTMLPVDEALIAQYGHEASNGVIAISLRYDTPARFPEAEGGVQPIHRQSDRMGRPPACCKSRHTLYDYRNRKDSANR